MDFLSQLLKTFLAESAIKALARKTGLKTRDLRKFVPLAVPFLIQMLTKNASSKEGASSLLEALTQHTGDRAVDEQIADADIVDGAKIIGHILGSGESTDLKNLSKQSRLSETAVSGILSSIAPALLTSLSEAVFGTGKKTRKKSGLGCLGSVLGGLFGCKKTRSRTKTDDESNGASLLAALLSLK